MQVEIITKQDLQEFRKELLHDIATVLQKQDSTPQRQWLRSKEARQLLGGISNGTLQNLRIKGLLHPSKIAGVYYYQTSEIMVLLNAGTGKQ
jgi:hypothetical protein